MTIPKILRSLLGVGLLCGAGLAARADEDITFQVDLSSYTNSAGQQAAVLVDVRGAINNWSGGSTLLNNGANVYTNTFTVVGAAADKFQYKFTFSTPAGVTWEDNNPPPGAGQPPDEGNNRVLLLVGGAQTLPVVPFFAPSVTLPINLPMNSVTYRVDMTEQIQLGNFTPEALDSVAVTGGLLVWNWGAGTVLTNDPALLGAASNIYSAVIEVPGYPGAVGGDYKFRMNGGWEETAFGTNRNYQIVGGPQVLPVSLYYDQTPGAVTNANVTFQVDLTPQVITGGFTNGVSTVGVAGHMISTSWPTEPMTNDPSLSGNASNVYSTTISISVPSGSVPTTTVGLPFRYKFRADGGWESAAIYGVNGNKDRRFLVTGGDQVLPLVTYQDASLCDLVQHATEVTVLLHLTNGTPDNAGVPFDKANDVIYLNGEFINWNAPSYWNTELPQMTNNPVGSDYYQQTYVLPAGRSVAQVFKFGVSGPAHSGIDNEAANGANHKAYIRNTSSAFTLPMAEFGSLFAATREEPAFGNLAAGRSSGGTVPITWLGAPCVTLQSRSSLSAGPWIDHPTTDAKGSTNWPSAGGPQYFRLQKRQLP